MPVAVGEPAPDFTLLDQDRQRVSLSALRGGPVLLVFYPFAFSALCGSELGRLRDSLSAYAGVTVLAVSTDPVYALKAFRALEGYDFQLLSDFWPHGEVARAYDVFDERKGAPRRSSYVVDREGRLQWSVHHEEPDGRDLDEHLHQLRSLV